MRKLFLAGAAAMLTATSFSFSTQAQTSSGVDSRQFNPSAKCAQILLTQDPIELRMAGMWAFGYIARANNNTIVVTPKRIRSVVKLLTGACSKNTNRKFNVLVEVLSLKLKKKRADNSANNSGGNPVAVNDRTAVLNSARVLLRKFYAPGADFVALTASLKPTPNDIRTVYGEPLASALVKRNAAMFKPGIAFRPKPEHSTFLILLSTTKRLQQGHGDLRKFPGGYKKVRQYFIKNVPIARFKFIKRGEKLGLAFDGLIFVNGRWVLIPKPWRALTR